MRYSRDPTGRRIVPDPRGDSQRRGCRGRGRPYGLFRPLRRPLSAGAPAPCQNRIPIRGPSRSGSVHRHIRRNADALEGPAVRHRGQGSHPPREDQTATSLPRPGPYGLGLPLAPRVGSATVVTCGCTPSSARTFAAARPPPARSGTPPAWCTRPATPAGCAGFPSQSPRGRGRCGTCSWRRRRPWRKTGGLIPPPPGGSPPPLARRRSTHESLCIPHRPDRLLADCSLTSAGFALALPEHQEVPEPIRLDPGPHPQHTPHIQ